MKFQSRILNFIIALFITSTCFAVTLDLHDQPKSDAKITGKIDSESGLIPIFTMKDGQWMKVANPQNGDVGWIKTSDLNNAAGQFNHGFTMTQRVISSGNKPQSYQITFGVPKTLSKEEANAMIQKMQRSQEEIQKSMQKMMDDMSNMGVGNFPVILPIVVMPPAEQTSPHSPSPQNKKTFHKP